MDTQIAAAKKLRAHPIVPVFVPMDAIILIVRVAIVNRRRQRPLFPARHIAVRGVPTDVEPLIVMEETALQHRRQQTHLLQNTAAIKQQGIAKKPHPGTPHIIHASHCV